MAENCLFRFPMIKLIISADAQTVVSVSYMMKMPKAMMKNILGLLGGTSSNTFSNSTELSPLTTGDGDDDDDFGDNEC